MNKRERSRLRLAGEVLKLLRDKGFRALIEPVPDKGNTLVICLPNDPVKKVIDLSGEEDGCYLLFKDAEAGVVRVMRLEPKGEFVYE